MADGARVTGRGFEYRFWFELDERVCFGIFCERGDADKQRMVVETKGIS